MNLISLSFLTVGSALLLAACGSGEKAVQSPSTNAVIDSTTLSSAPKVSTSKSNKGGQVVESGKYHLELVPEKSANETHLDLFLQRGDDHQAITGAKVSGEIQSPDGQSKTITFTYDAEGKHYAAVFPGKTAGAYQLKVTATIGNDQADGRFSFDR